MPDILLLIMMSLVAFRITWFITRDSFPPVRWVRERVIELDYRTAKSVLYRDTDHQQWRDDRGPWTWLADLITCHWCISVWVAAGVTLAVDATIGLRLPLLWFGAVAALAAIIATCVDARMSSE